MKTYKDGLLEAAKVCDNYVESYIYSAMAIEIRALAAQEDQRSEAERVGSPQPQCNTQSSDRPTTAEDLLRECLDWGLPEDLKERIDAAIGKKK
jgi:hypothetical protein